jgi:hypothetical protein
MNRLRGFHRVVGLSTLAAFLASGAFMMLVAHPARLPDGGQLMFVSRHIYILANSSRSGRPASGTQEEGKPRWDAIRFEHVLGNHWYRVEGSAAERASREVRPCRCHCSPVA